MKNTFTMLFTLTADFVETFARWTAGITCVGPNYQPKTPKSLKI